MIMSLNKKGMVFMPKKNGKIAEPEQNTTAKTTADAKWVNIAFVKDTINGKASVSSKSFYKKDANGNYITDNKGDKVRYENVTMRLMRDDKIVKGHAAIPHYCIHPSKRREMNPDGTPKLNPDGTNVYKIYPGYKNISIRGADTPIDVTFYTAQRDDKGNVIDGVRPEAETVTYTAEELNKAFLEAKSYLYDYYKSKEAGKDAKKNEAPAKNQVAEREIPDVEEDFSEDFEDFEDFDANDAF